MLLALDPRDARFDAPPSLRRRAVSLTLSVAITLLMLLGFLGLAGKLPEKPRFKGEAVMVDLPPEKESADVTESAMTMS